MGWQLAENSSEGVITGVTIDPTLNGLIVENTINGDVVLGLEVGADLTFKGRSIEGITNLSTLKLNGIDTPFIASTKDEVLINTSHFVNQLPGALNTPVQIIFDAQATASDPVSVSASGTVNINQVDSYKIKVRLNVGRTGSGQVVNFKFRVLLSGVQIIDTISYSFVSQLDRDPFIENFLLEVPTLPDEAAWTDITGDYPTTSTEIVVDSDDNIFVISGEINSNNKVFTSINGGTNWTNISTGIPFASRAQALVIDSNNILYAGTSNDGVFRFDANTLTWVADNVGISTFLVMTLFVDEEGGFIYAGTNLQGIYRRPFTGGIGVPWVAVNTGIIDSNMIRFDALIKSKNNIYAATVGPSSGSGIYKSSDPGSGWTRVFVGGKRSLTADSEGNLYISGDAGSVGVTLPVLKSTDDGINWNQVGIGTLPLSTSSGDGGYKLLSPHQNNNVYLGLNKSNPSWRSEDGGSTWQNITFASGNDNENLFLFKNTLYATGFGGVIGKIEVNSTSIPLVCEQMLDSQNSGQNDGGLFTSTTSTPVSGTPWSATSSSSIEITRNVKLEDIILGEDG